MPSGTHCQFVSRLEALLAGEYLHLVGVYDLRRGPTGSVEDTAHNGEARGRWGGGGWSIVNSALSC